MRQNILKVIAERITCVGFSEENTRIFVSGALGSILGTSQKHKKNACGYSKDPSSRLYDHMMLIKARFTLEQAS